MLRVKRTKFEINRLRNKKVMTILLRTILSPRQLQIPDNGEGQNFYYFQIFKCLKILFYVKIVGKSKSNQGLSIVSTKNVFLDHFISNLTLKLVKNPLLFFY